MTTPLPPRMGYIEALGIHWPKVEAHCQGPNYEDLVHDAGDPLPTKAEMDDWMTTPTEEDYVVAVTNFMNEKAMERRYDSIYTAALRAGYPGPFHDEGVAYAHWMDVCWASLYTRMSKVLTGQEPYPSVKSLLADLPPLVLPDRPAGAV